MARRFTLSHNQLDWRELDGQLAVRNARSGSTHLLEPLASEVLRELLRARAGMTTEDLVARLADENDVREEWLAAIEAVLAEFERLGLAEPQAD